jgi:multiple sugar transport system ATP-binding protein
MTMLYATPDELEALSMGQRVGVIRDGRMVQVGTPDELFDGPSERFVAEHVGSPRMNLLPAESGGEDGARVRLPFAEVAGGPWAAALRRLPAGTPLLFGFRPHDLAPATGDARGPRFDARVELTEPLGDVTVLDLEARGAAFKMVLPEEQALRYREGDELELELAVGETHLFAMDTGTAIR